MKFAAKSVAVVAVSVAAVAGLSACSKSSAPENLPTPSISIPTGAPTNDSGNVTGGGAEAGKNLPSNWPSDVPTPSGMELQGGGSTGTAMSAAWLGTGDVKAVQTEMNGKFKNAGFTSETSFGGGNIGGVTLWKKGTMKVQVTIAQQNGKVVVSETVLLNS